MDKSEVLDIEKLDIRVGKIFKVWKHPESEKLYCQTIDIGGGEVRSVATSL
jgi:tRNA-binding EMAP/Myf-like protein